MATTASSEQEQYHKPTSVEDLTEQNIRTIAQLDQASLKDRTLSDRVVDAISAFCGSMAFIYVHLLWFGFWISINQLPTPHRFHFDPYPFQFLTFVVSLEAIFLSTFILISQNRQARLGDRRNQLDLQINLLSEQENSKMLAMLEAIQNKLGIMDSDPEVRILEESTRPEKMMQQIQRTLEVTKHKHSSHENL